MGLCRVRAAVLRKVLKQVRDAPLKNLWGVVGGGGGGGGGRSTKKYSRKGKLNEEKFMHAN